MSRFLNAAPGLAALLLAAGISLAAESPLLPVPRFTPGERVRYRMHLEIESESSLKPGGEDAAGQAPVRLAIDLTWQVEALAVEPTGEARLRSLLEAIDIQSSAPGARTIPEGFVGRAVTYRLLPDGLIDDIEAPKEWLQGGQPPPWLRNWLEQGSGAPSGLPAHGVKPGDQWSGERDFEIPGLPRQRLVSESEYLRDETFGETPCASVLTRFELSGRDTREETALDRTRTRIERRVEGGGTRLSCIDLRTGRLLESTQRSREQIWLSVRELSTKTAPARPPMVVESRTTSESHLRVVE